MAEQLQVWTIGHSNHSPEALIEVLRKNDVEVLVDVRSHPFSRYVDHFNQPVLQKLIESSGMRYVFLGRQLGGRPEDPNMYDSEDHVDYRMVAESPNFRDGLAQLTEAAKTGNTAMMCSEEDPTHCHRRLLITRVLTEEGATVTHIRGDASVISEADLAKHDPPVALSLFDQEGGQAPWRSQRSVSRSTQQSDSSDH